MSLFPKAAAASRDARNTAAPLWDRRPYLCAALIICFFTGLRFWIAASGQIDLAQDEAQYWDWSRRPQLSYYSKGPLIAWLIAFWTHIFGVTEAGVRFGAVLNNGLAQALLFYWTAGLLQRPRLGLIVLCLIQTAPLFIVSGVLMTTDNPLLLCWTAGMVGLTALTERPKARWPLWFLAAAVGLGVLAKYTMLAFLGIALIYIAVLSRKQVLDRPRAVTAVRCMAAAALAGMAPILMWNAQNDFVSFLHVGKLAGIDAAAPVIRFDRFPEYLASQLALILPWWLCLMLWQGKRSVTFCCGLSKAVAYGTRDNPEESRRAYCFQLLLCLGFWPLWLSFLLWSFHTRVYPNWSAMSYVAGVVLAGLGTEQLLKRIFSPWGKRLCRACLVLSLLVCALVHGQHLITSIIPLPDTINPTVRVKGWSALGKKLEEARLSMPHPDNVFFFSDSYDVTAALAFYLPGRPVTYCADFGRRKNQYDLWPDPNGDTIFSLRAGGETPRSERAFTAPPSPYAGWDAIYVTRKPQREKPEPLQRMFRDAGGRPQVYETRHAGQKGRTFGYLPLYGYSGLWPRSAEASH